MSLHFNSKANNSPEVSNTATSLSTGKVEKKLAVAAVFLLLCLLLLISTSYAWFSISRIPEIAGIETHIGSNGNLEIALLNDRTYRDPSTIRSTVGDSAVVQDPTVSNQSWGNIIDLGHESYGLTQIALLPARLNAAMGGEGHNMVADSLLTVPSFDADGRINLLESNLVSAAYRNHDFTYLTANQSYGVRGIGSIDTLTVQQTALSNARSLVPSYTAAAHSATVSMWSAHGIDLVNMWIRGGKGEIFTGADIAVIRDSATRMNGALSYIDAALRQSVVGYAASQLDSESEFQLLRETVLNTAYPLSQLINSLPMQPPADLSDWITTLDQNRLEIHYLIQACDALQGDSYVWDRVKLLLTPLLDGAETHLLAGYYGDEWKLSEAPHMPTYPNVTLSPRAGIPASVADFCGNYTADPEDHFFAPDSLGVYMVITSTSTADPAHLVQMTKLLEESEAAAGDTAIRATQLKDVYGYAVDLAVRCNEPCNLLLQTTPELRVSGTESETEDLPSEYQGSGSYMRFTSGQLAEQQIVLLMDAIRVGFMDQQNTLLAVAKLNTSNYTVTEEGISAPLYLYDHTVALDGSLSMGERRADRSAITTLDDGVATVVTAIVWLDGDHVDNSLAAYTARSMEGSLNLQFSTDAQLSPSTD